MAGSKIKSSVVYGLVDENTISRLYYDNPELLPRIGVDRHRDITYNTRHLQNLILSGIIRGDTVPEMAATLRRSTIGVNQSAAIRSVRTAATSAENGGRQARYEAFEQSGVSGLSKQWLATGDERTRESHMAVNGEIVPINGRFSNGLAYPADPEGAASEVYNCRCTMRMVINGVNSADAGTYRAASVATFTRWLNARNENIPPQMQSQIPVQFFAERNRDDYDGIWLPPKEYGKVYHTIATDISAKEKRLGTFTRIIGKYVYTIRYNGTNDFTIIEKRLYKDD